MTKKEEMLTKKANRFLNVMKTYANLVANILKKIKENWKNFICVFTDFWLKELSELAQ